MRGSGYSWNNKVGIWLNNSRNVHAHDPESFCVTGDKVILLQCRKLSKIKSHHVHEIIKPAARQNITGDPATKWEASLLKHNKSQMDKPLKQWF